ncbi:hypothetical protein [Burkholderia sp. MSMB1498]|uniref:hypothetical protein n=1 Tax=Burkholderia sp. MSMB1498 TaxID=1637842 RepID=UPI0012E36632|nr:hypothetical protein [Burkholderia sp. MSMB1498]
MFESIPLPNKFHFGTYNPVGCTRSESIRTTMGGENVAQAESSRQAPASSTGEAASNLGRFLSLAFLLGLLTVMAAFGWVTLQEGSHPLERHHRAAAASDARRT